LAFPAYCLCVAVAGVLRDWDELTVGWLLFLPFFFYVLWAMIDLFWPAERPGQVRRLKRALYRAEKQRAGMRRTVLVWWLRWRLRVLFTRRRQA
jgi:hypothetical protein